MKKFPILLLLTACWSLAAAQERPQVPAAQKRNLRTEIIAADSTGELLAQLRNMPNIDLISLLFCWERCALCASVFAKK